MKAIKINRMTIDKFKGLDHLDIMANGEDVVISGENGTGKTTTFDAYIWALTCKFSDGSAAEDSIKQFGENGTTPVDGGIIHSVEVEFDTGISTVIIRREYVEVTHNPPIKHTTNYFVNGVPRQKKEFDAFMETFVPTKMFSILSMPTHFCKTLAWKERRKILMSVFGNITEVDVINSMEELKPLTGLLGSNNVDDFSKILKVNIKKYGNELKSISARIDELNREFTNTDSNKTELLEQIKQWQKERADLDVKIKEYQKQYCALIGLKDSFSAKKANKS